MAVDIRTEDGKREFARWILKQLHVQTKHLAVKKLVTDTRARAYASWALPGVLCIGRVVGVHDRKQAYWVISGDAPTDEVELKVAATPREAARHFAMKWQLMAARLGDRRPEPAGGKQDAWSEVGGNLAGVAEKLYRLTLEDEHWTSPPPEAQVDSGVESGSSPH